MTNGLQLTFREYNHAADFETLLGLQACSIGSAVRELNGGHYPAGAQRAFFWDEYQHIPPTVVCLKNAAGEEEVVASFQLSTTNENGGTAVSLDSFYVDWRNLGAEKGNVVATEIVAKALERAHEERLPLETPPLITDRNALGFLKENGFYVLVEDEPYPEGSLEREDFGWVRCAVLRHEATAHYALSPDRAVLTIGNTGYQGRDPKAEIPTATSG
jgi:hypothetical protein